MASTTRRVAIAAALSVALFLSYCAGVGSSIAKEEALSAARRQNTEEGAAKLSKAEKADTVWYICEWSRRMADGPLEEHCGRLQDTYQMEYLCKERNSEATNVCWVEDTSVSPQQEVETI